MASDEVSSPTPDMDAEDNVLQNLGYGNQYRRVVSSLSSLSMVISLASPMSAILLISSYQIYYGGYWGLTWGWFVPAIVFFTQALAIAELCSAMPVNGAFYWWTAYLAPESLSRPLSFLSGWLNVFQLFSALASFTYALAQAYTYAISLLTPQWTPTNGQITAIAIGVMILWAIVGSTKMEQITILYVISTAVIVVTQLIYMIGLPVTHAAQHKPFAQASKVFGEFRNFSTWDAGVAVPSTFFSVAWVVTGWCSPAFMAEETRNARIAAPRSIVGSYVVMAVMGWIVCVISAFCVTDIDAAASDPRQVTYLSVKA